MKDIILKILKEDIDNDSFEKEPITDSRLEGKKSEYIQISNDIKEISDTIEDLTSQLRILKSKLIVSKSHIDPHITINRQNYSAGVRYMGRFRLYLNDTEKPKIITLSIGNIDMFNGDDDPKIMDIAKEKAIKYTLKNYPDIYN